MLIIFMYIFINIVIPQPFDGAIMINNLFFMAATAVIAVCINHVKYILTRKEVDLLIELKKARDALWSEMELAKRIQTALLPEKKVISGYEIEAAMLPATEVGGDYYDIIETPGGEKWVTIGDVSDHGVDSGLIMMMAQTSVISKLTNNSKADPAAVLGSVNTVIRKNISRMGSDHYMTMMAIRVDPTQIVAAGKHQDILIYRSAINQIQVVPTRGAWLGISDDIHDYMKNKTIAIDKGDIILLFTDGFTEATNENGEMFGQKRLERSLSHYADLPTSRIRDKIIEDVTKFQDIQADDMTIVVIKKQ